MMRRSVRVFCLAAAVFLAITALPAMGQAMGYRLFMKDGSYQVITKYQVIGKRVRYYSAERHDWEEVPVSMVDWVATEKWKREYAPGGDQPVVITNPSDPGQVEAAKLDAEERAAREAERDRIPIILPGLRLPDESGVWALDTFNGQPELAHITQTNGDLNRTYEHSVKPYRVGSSRGSRELIEQDGFAAPVELHIQQPVFYVRLTRPKGAPNPPPIDGSMTVNTHGADEQKNDKGAISSPNSTYAILALNTNPHRRWATADQVDRLVEGPVPTFVTEMKKEIMPGGYWMKLTPNAPLLIGQYALIEILDPHTINVDAWAFGINPQAPDNTDTVSPVDNSDSQ